MEAKLLKIAIILFATGLFRLQSVHSRSLTFGHRYGSHDELEQRGPDVRALLAALSTPELPKLAARNGRRSSDKQKLKEFLRRLRLKKATMRDSVDEGDIKNPLRIPYGLNLQEKENALNEMRMLRNHASSLLDHPYVEKGLNDYLVIKSNAYYDPMARFVPNDIFYPNTAKKCVNWLDNCNVKDMREKLLTVVNTP